MARELLQELIDATGERLLRICKANDRNGDFDGLTRDHLLVVILGWALNEPDFKGTLRFLLELAP